MAKLRVINFEFELHILTRFFALRCLTLQRFNPLHAFTVNSRQEHARSHTSEEVGQATRYVGMAKLRVANFEFEFELQIFNPFFALQMFNPAAV